VHVNAEIVDALETRYGAPREMATVLEMAEREYLLCRRAVQRGRAHDVTLFILRGDIDATRREIAVIRKWSYPPDVYRPPSGGVEPGEEFEAGAVREALEETGLEVALERYLVRMRARFAWQGERLDWTTHVFSACWLGGEISPRDTREIAEARWVTVAELKGPLREKLLARGSPGFRYRVALQDAALAELDRRAWQENAR
jgi:ADP-ribose pyrophosphatase YjhB (NUDIX family)